MKHFNIGLLAFAGVLASCNHHSEERPYVYYDIVRELEPQSKVLDWGNMTSEERHQYPRQGFIINSVDGFPEEANIDMTDLKLTNIDFSRYTLLVNYTLIPGYINGHKLLWFYDNMEDEYVFQSNFRMVYSEAEDGSYEDMFTYYRAAVLVNKISSGSKVSFRSFYW